jgi:hypothetical protein
VSVAENNPAGKTPETHASRRTSLLGLLAAILVTAAIVGLHLVFLFHAGGFWRDEVNLINLASSHSLADMKKDSFPVLMPLLVRGWTAIGPGKSDLFLRGLGALIGLGIPAAFWLAAWAARRAPPLLSLSLFCLNGTLLVFGDSVRAYGLGSLFIVLTAAGTVAFLRQPSWPRTGWLALLATLSVQSLFHNAILVGAICLGAWAVCWREKNRRAAAQIFLAGLVAAVSLLPYVSGWLAGLDSTAVLRTGLKSWRFAAAFQDALGFPLGEFFYVWTALALALVFLAAAILCRARKISAVTGDDLDDLSLFAGTTVFAAVTGFILFLKLAAFPSQSWYLLPLMALVAVCFEIGLPVLREKMRAPFFGLVAATALIAIPTASRDLHNRFTNVDVWARELQAHAAPDDYIVIVPWFCGITFNHYFTGASAWTTLPPLADHATHRYDLVRDQIQNTNAIQPVLERIVTTLQHGQRVWVLAGMGWMDIPEPGTVAPPSLPPAPLENSGWSEAPYTMVWDSQVGHLLGDRAIQFARVKNPTEGMQIIENTELFMAAGWKNPAASQNQKSK